MKQKKIKVYTSFVTPITLKEIINKELLPIFIIRNIKDSKLIGDYSDTPIHMKELSPSTELFRKKRDGLITEKEFNKEYALDVIENVNLEKLLNRIVLLDQCSDPRGLHSLPNRRSSAHQKL